MQQATSVTEKEKDESKSKLSASLYSGSIPLPVKSCSGVISNTSHMDYEVTRSNIKILKQIHSLGDDQYKRLMAYMKALQKLEQMHVTYMGWKYVY